MSQPPISTSDLIHQKCVPCEGGTAPLTNAEEDAYLSAVTPWRIDRTSTHQLSREYQFKNFAQVLVAVNRTGQLAETEGHHPNLYIYQYRHLRIELYTHAINGLSINDFILAVKINKLLGAA